MSEKQKEPSRNYLDSLSYWREYPDRDIEFVRWYPCDVDYLSANEIFSNSLINTSNIATFYMHIPFCNQICTSCPYNKFHTRNQLVDDYLQALKNEITHYSEQPYLKDVELISGYIGGGTPTTLKAKQLDDLFTHLHQKFNIRKGSSITLESTPIDIDPHKIATVLKHGVDRISLGIQTFNDQLLKNLGRSRTHTGKKAVEVIEMLKREGVEHICIDLMIGIPGQTMELWQEDIDMLLALPIDSFSVYNYLVLPASDAFFKIQSGQVAQCPTTQEADEMYWYFVNRVLSNNYVAVTYNDFGGPITKEWESMNVETFPIHNKDNLPYKGLDPSSFYLTDHLSHSWYECGDMLSFGAGAYGYLNNYMYLNEPEINKYIDMCNSGSIPVSMGSCVDEKERMARSLVLGMKLLRVKRKDFIKHHHVDLYSVFKNEIDYLIKEELIILTDETLELTFPKGWFYSDNVCKTFYSNKNYKLPQPSPSSTDILKWRKRNQCK